jgi:hypothetical protein
MRWIVLFLVFLLGLAYVAYLNAILTDVISGLDRVMIIALSVAGYYFLFSTIVTKAAEFLAHRRGIQNQQDDGK